MLDRHLLVLFPVAATLLAVTPGPGIFYVLARTLSLRRNQRVASGAGMVGLGVFVRSAETAQKLGQENDINALTAGPVANLKAVLV